jgi:ACS family tartrate transporter-like MFS transporter
MVMIPHVAGLIGMVLISRSSDRKMERRLHAAIPATFAGAALVSLGATHSVALTIALLAIAAAGMYSVYGPTFSLPSEFLCGYAAASGLALVSMISNTAGFVGPSLLWCCRRK